MTDVSMKDESDFSGEELKRDEDGVTIIEYAVLIGLFGMCILGAISYVGQTVADVFSQASARVEESTHQTPIGRINRSPDSDVSASQGG